MPIERMTMPFPREEYLARLDRTKTKMEAAGIEVLLVTAAANITYLSGYAAESAYVAQGLVVRLDEEEPTLYVRRQDAPAGIHTAFMARDRIVGIPEHYVGDYRVDGYDFIVDRLEAAKSGTKHIGIEFVAISGATLDKLRARLTTARIADASGLVTLLRLVKSDNEITVLREAAEIADAAMAKAVEAIRPGVRECDAAAEIMAQMVRGTVRLAGDRCVAPLMPAGSKTGTSHLTWTGEPFRRGTHVNVELGGVRHRYTAALMRTISLGPPTGKLKRLHDGMLDGLEAALLAAKPGATCGAVASAFGAKVEYAGFIKDSRCGYPIGIDWLEPSASLRPDDPTVLEPNMVFHLMLGMWVEEDFGAVVSETIRIAPSGAEALGKTPRRLYVN
jgi:Xaa-Pro aminopeptidase